ncbi:MAG: Rrf2 family transcriptional regulator [Verrucomicrobiae bacterium]|nr:Rrf2 family transcriptional regulator [Verrucomicrobiae bacterium]
MKASIKSEYACRAVEALCLHFPNPKPLSIEQIARSRRIPPNYLVQILLELKHNGIVQSHRGKAGGYLLAKLPQQITVGDVLRAVQGYVIDLPGLADPDCPAELKSVWHRIKAAAETAAQSITFDQIAQAARQPAPLYEI